VKLEIIEAPGELWIGVHGQRGKTFPNVIEAVRRHCPETLDGYDTLRPATYFRDPSQVAEWWALTQVDDRLSPNGLLRTEEPA